ncbi:dinucleotide-utilizing enzyme [Microbacterium sp. RD1]|uniref:dinucleotide-utilizing enzyme n=1 Tax=Microbacterium sp. RD1 TaxID=3457313 RepID=UPI003FA571D2
MNSRPSLIRNIPFWVLLVVSVVLTAVGGWLVSDRLGRIESAITTPTEQSNVEVFVSQSAVIGAGAVLAAGLLGILLTLTVAAIASLRPRVAEVVEEIEWTSEDETIPAPAAAPVIAEDPDVETPSDATPPPSARD